MSTLRQAAIKKLRARVIRRHGRDSLPISINRRRIYILPTRFGLMLAAILAAMLIAGLNYNSNLALAFVARGPERWADLAHALLMTNEFAFVD